MLSMTSLHSATVLYSNSYYTVVASIFLISAASCKAICRVASCSQNFRLFSAILAKVTHPSNATHAAHVLICISAGKGSQHFSAFHSYSGLKII